MNRRAILFMTLLGSISLIGFVWGLHHIHNAAMIAINRYHELNNPEVYRALFESSQDTIKHFMKVTIYQGFIYVLISVFGLSYSVHQLYKELTKKAN